MITKKRITKIDIDTAIKLHNLDLKNKRLVQSIIVSKQENLNENLSDSLAKIEEKYTKEVENIMDNMISKEVEATIAFLGLSK